MTATSTSLRKRSPRAKRSDSTDAPAARPPARVSPATPPTPAVADSGALWREYLATRSRPAFDALVGEYAPYVQQVAARMSRRLPPSVDPDDLCSAGNFGLMDAINAFDPSRGVKFQTFALKRIAGAMNDSLRAQDIAPRLARRRETIVRRARDDFRKSQGRTPTEEELLRLLHADGTEARAILDGAAIPVLASMTAPSGEDGEGPRGRPEAMIALAAEREPMPPAATSPALERDLQKWLGRGLSRSERLIIWLYYFESMTMKEIGQVLGICEGRVSQIHALLLERLRARMVREAEGTE